MEIHFSRSQVLLKEILDVKHELKKPQDVLVFFQTPSSVAWSTGSSSERSMKVAHFFCFLTAVGFSPFSFPDAERFGRLLGSETV